MSAPKILVPLEAEAAVVAEQLHFFPEDLAAAIGNASLLRQIRGKVGGELYRSTENPNVLVRRLGMYDFPTDAKENPAAHIEWYEDELQQLTRKGSQLAALPHYTAIATLPEHSLPSIWTVTEYKDELTPVTDEAFYPYRTFTLDRGIGDYLLTPRPGCRHRRVISDLVKKDQWHRAEGEQKERGIKYVVHDLDAYPGSVHWELKEYQIRLNNLPRTVLMRRGYRELRREIAKQHQRLNEIESGS